MGESSPTAAHDTSPRPLAALGLRRATAEDVERLKDVLAEAFFEDPVLNWLMPDDTKRRARLRRFFAIELRHLTLPRGCVWTTNDLTGAALSLPPGAWRVPLRVTLLEGTALGRTLRLRRKSCAGATTRHRPDLLEVLADARCALMNRRLQRNPRSIRGASQYR